jgi:hypothetical protein
MPWLDSVLLCARDVMLDGTAVDDAVFIDAVDALGRRKGGMLLQLPGCIRAYDSL